MGVFAWACFGLIAGIIARCIMPGKEHFGIILTIVLGIIGALIGGAISTALGFGNINGFNITSLAIATAGAIIVLFAMHKIRMLKKS